MSQELRSHRPHNHGLTWWPRKKTKSARSTKNGTTRFGALSSQFSCCTSPKGAFSALPFRRLGRQNQQMGCPTFSKGIELAVDLSLGTACRDASRLEDTEPNHLDGLQMVPVRISRCYPSTTSTAHCASMSRRHHVCLLTRVDVQVCSSANVSHAAHLTIHAACHPPRTIGKNKRVSALVAASLARHADATPIPATRQREIQTADGTITSSILSVDPYPQFHRYPRCCRLFRNVRGVSYRAFSVMTIFTRA